MSLYQPFLVLIENAVNHALNSDASVENRLVALEGKKVLICITGFDINILLGFRNNAVNLSSVGEQEPDLTIKGTPIALLNLLTNHADNSAAQVDFSGDVNVARDLRGLVSEFEYDWEGLIAGFFGGTVAHKMSRVQSNFSANVNSMRNNIHREMADFLVQESRLLVSAAELSGFCDGVDCLREDVDRLQRRIEILSDKLAG